MRPLHLVLLFTCAAAVRCTAADADTDADGIPDAWERSFANNITTLGAGIDSDGDGQLDADEYTADTNPLDPKEVLRITALVAPRDIAGTGSFATDVTWTCKPSRWYNIEASADLLGPWVTAAANLFPTGTTTLNRFNDAALVSVPGTRFYRVRAKLPLAADGQPFVIHGDSAWFLIVQATKAEAGEYLENRRLKGFNTLMVQMMVPLWGYPPTHPPQVNRDGYGPFNTAGDFDTPNEDYFTHVDWVLDAAAAKGILVCLAPCWFNNLDGWGPEVIANGETRCRNFGRYLGNRYRNRANIAWVHGGDYTPVPGSQLETNAHAILEGIAEHDPAKSNTFHGNRSTTALEQTNLASSLEMNGTYSGDLTYLEALRAHNQSDKPHFLLEGRYEGTQNWDGHVNSPQIVRAGAYWSLLSGSTGHIFGSINIYDFGWRGVNWRTAMDAPGSQHMVHLKTLFTGRMTVPLIPDQDHTFVTSGYGTFGGNDYVTAACRGDGGLAIIYVPSTGTGLRTIAVRMSELSGAATARWYNPTSGIYTTIAGSPLANSGSLNFTTPGNNGTGTNDWVLVLETSPPQAP